MRVCLNSLALTYMPPTRLRTPPDSWATCPVLMGLGLAPIFDEIGAAPAIAAPNIEKCKGEQTGWRAIEEPQPQPQSKQEQKKVHVGNGYGKDTIGAGALETIASVSDNGIGEMEYHSNSDESNLKKTDSSSSGRVHVTSK